MDATTGTTAPTQWAQVACTTRAQALVSTVGPAARVALPAWDRHSRRSPSLRRWLRHTRNPFPVKAFRGSAAAEHHHRHEPGVPAAGRRAPSFAGDAGGLPILTAAVHSRPVLT
jgi:hypothetical protein